MQKACILGLIVALMPVGLAFGDNVMNVRLSGGGSTVTLGQGATFNIELEVAVTDTILAAETRIRIDPQGSPGTGASGVLEITGPTTVGGRVPAYGTDDAPWDIDAAANSGFALEIVPGGMDPAYNSDASRIGATAMNAGGVGPMGGYSSPQLLATLNMKVAVGAAPGTYVISADDIHFADDAGGMWDFPTTLAGTVGTTLELVVEDGPAAPYITAAVSTRDHGGTWYDIDLVVPPGASHSEPRYQPGIFEFTFDQNVEPTDGSLGLGDEVVLTCGGGACGESLNSLGIVGDTLTVDVSGLPDDACLQIDISGLTCPGCGATYEMIPESWRIALIAGDAVESFVVNLADVIQTKLQSGQAATGANFRFDTVVSGVINLADVVRQKLNSGGGASCP